MNEYVEYKNSMCSLKNILGLGCIHLYSREELLPYITRIISKLNEWLVMEGKEDQSENVELFVGYYEDGMDKIVTPDRFSELVADYEYEGGDDRCFVAAWTNVFSTIYLDLLYNYPHLFTTSPIDCNECCGSIKTDSEGNLVYTSGTGNLSSPHIGCGCGS